jgi:hypothetical protein
LKRSGEQRSRKSLPPEFFVPIRLSLKIQTN